MPGEVERKYGGLLEKKWTSVIRLQKKVKSFLFFQFEGYFLSTLDFMVLRARKNSTVYYVN